MISPKTIYSVLAALLVWDGVMYITLGTSPVIGNLLGPSGNAEMTHVSSDQNFTV